MLDRLSSVVFHGWETLINQAACLGKKISYLCSSLKDLALKVSRCFYDCFCPSKKDSATTPNSLKNYHVSPDEAGLNEQTKPNEVAIPIPSKEELLRKELENLEAEIEKASLQTEPSIQDIANLRQAKRQIKTRLADASIASDKDRYKAAKEKIKRMAKNREPFKVIFAIKNEIKKGSYQPIFKQYCTLNGLSEIDPLDSQSPEQAVKSRVHQLESKLVEESLPHASVLAAFDQESFVHGTTTAIFSLSARTDHSLISTEELLQAGMAPMSGELYQGGMDTFSLNTQGHTAAIKLNQNLGYSLSKVMKDYSQKFLFKPEIYQLDPKEISQCIKQFGCTRFHVILLKLMRAKQWGDAFFAETQRDERQKMFEEISKTVKVDLQVIDNAFFLIRHLSVNPQLKEFEGRLAMTNAIDQLIKDGYLDQNLSESRLSEFFPQHAGEGESPAASELNEKQTNLYLQDLNSCYHKVLNSREGISTFIIKALQFRSSHSHLSFEECLQTLESTFNQYKAKAEDYLQHCQNILVDDAVLELDEESKDYLRQAQPILLFSQSSDTFKPYGYEYRSQKPLKLGREITFIGVDNEMAHRQVTSYLQKHAIENVRVIKTDLIRKCTLNY